MTFSVKNLMLVILPNIIICDSESQYPHLDTDSLTVSSNIVFIHAVQC